MSRMETNCPELRPKRVILGIPLGRGCNQGFPTYEPDCLHSGGRCYQAGDALNEKPCEFYERPSWIERVLGIVMICHHPIIHDFALRGANVQECAKNGGESCNILKKTKPDKPTPQ